MMDMRILPLGWTALAVVCAFAAVKDEVKVSDFGWDSEDSTRFAQAALDAGARRVIFDRQAGPWTVTPLTVRSETEIVFEEGVELLAKKGAFIDMRDHLLNVRGVTNVALVGRGEKGGILRMHKPDYRQPPYLPSEWRHTLSLAGAVGVRVENMSFIASGGDGICIGGLKDGLNHCRDIVIRRCVCDGNMRQGISACSVENLLIEDTVLKNTDGRLPKAGIDFEPDWGVHRIVNCTMRRCRVEGNAGCGILLYLGAQNGASRPIGITVEDCVITGNDGNGVSVTVGSADSRVAPPQGAILFTNCLIAANRSGSIEVCRKPTGFPITFADCTTTNQPKGVSFPASGWEGAVPDGVLFRNFTAHCTEGQEWFRPVPAARGLNPAVPTNIVGDVTVIHQDGRREKVVLDSAWSRERFALATSETLPVRVERWPDVERCTVHDSAPGQMVKLVPLRRKSGWRGIRYAFFAERPGEVHFRARYVQSAPGPFASESQLFIGRGRYSHARARKPLAVQPQPGTTSTVFSVSVPVRGFYYMATQGFLVPFLLEEADVPVALDVYGPITILLPPKEECPLLLTMPSGTKSCVFLAKGMVEGKVFAPDGTLAGIRSPGTGWSPVLLDGSTEGIWKVNLRKADGAPNASCTIDLVGAPGLLWLSPGKTVSF